MIGIVCSLGAIVCCSDADTDTTPPEEGGEIDGAVYSTHFVQVYVDVKELSVISTGDHVTVHCNGTKTSGSVLGDSFGDKGYNKRIAVNSTKAISNRISKIDLVCAGDFDERHKAGTSLSDVVFLAGVSPYAYIRSNYTETYDWKRVPELFAENAIQLNFQAGYFPVCKRLSEIGANDLMMLDPVFCLFFEAGSTPKQSCKTTLTITDDKGKTISAVFDWPAGK